MEKNFDFDEVYNTLSLRTDIREIFRILLDMNEDERRKTARYLTWYFQGKVKVVFNETDGDEIRFDDETGVATICVVGRELDVVVEGFEEIEKCGWLEDPFK